MKDKAAVVDSYISDMLALEQHISKALKGQITDLKSYPNVTRQLETILATVEGHASSLEGLLKERGGEGVSSVKKVGSVLLGFAAGAIDLVRNEGLPKNLRDDYTACSLATIGYVMLHTTALSLDERAVAQLALAHLKDHAQLVMTLYNVIPAAVIRFLQQEGLPVLEDRLGQIGENLEGVWRDRANQVPDPQETSV